MKTSFIKLNLLALLLAFSVAWISDTIAVVLNEKKYESHEVSDKSTEENNFENKLKNLFISAVLHSKLLDLDSLVPDKINALDLFSAKETCLKNSTPPPKRIA